MSSDHKIAQKEILQLKQFLKAPKRHFDENVEPPTNDFCKKYQNVKMKCEGCPYSYFKTGNLAYAGCLDGTHEQLTDAICILAKRDPWDGRDLKTMKKDWNKNYKEPLPKTFISLRYYIRQHLIKLVKYCEKCGYI